MTDGFLAELVKLSPPNLTRMAFVGCDMLRRVSLSPMGTCPALKELDLSQCSRLEYLLVQSESLETLKLSLCGKLTKVLLHCRNLAHLDLREASAQDWCCWVAEGGPLFFARTKAPSVTRSCR